MKKHFLSTLFLWFAILVLASCKRIDLHETGLITDKAMVVSAHPISSAIGTDILRKGGNAIDAAIAVEFALAVVYPDAGNIGGGGFMVIRLQDGTTDALDYREKAPDAASEKMYFDTTGRFIKNVSLKGHLAAGVPGTVDGMVNAHQKYGSLPWETLIEPAIDIAERGFPLTEKEAKKLNQYKKDFVQRNTVRPYFLLKKRWKQGDTILMPELAETLKLIRNHKGAGFYQGVTAEKIISEMKRGQGLLTKEDLLNYRAVWRKPVVGTFKEYRVISMSPPSAGGIGLLQLLKISETYPIKKWGWNTSKTVHLMTEAERRVYADRSDYIGDPDFENVPIDQLLASEYLFERMENYSTKKATRSRKIQPGKVSLKESNNTTHYSIVDKDRNAVSATTTLNSTFGSKVVVGGAGFLLNNQMNDFNVAPGKPNQYKLIQGAINNIKPGKRMLSSMTPTIVEKRDSLFMVVGSPGGSTIITTVYQTILNVTLHNLPMQGAVNAPRFHHQWRPDGILAEWGSFKLGTTIKLWTMGHRIVPTRKGIGRCDAILVLPGGRLEGGADPRGDDTATGY